MKFAKLYNINYNIAICKAAMHDSSKPHACMDVCSSWPCSLLLDRPECDSVRVSAFQDKRPDTPKQYSDNLCTINELITSHLMAMKIHLLVLIL